MKLSFSWKGIILILSSCWIRYSRILLNMISALRKKLNNYRRMYRISRRCWRNWRNMSLMRRRLAGGLGWLMLLQLQSLVELNKLWKSSLICAKYSKGRIRRWVRRGKRRNVLSVKRESWRKRNFSCHNRLNLWKLVRLEKNKFQAALNLWARNKACPSIQKMKKNLVILWMNSNRKSKAFQQIWWKDNL